MVQHHHVRHIKKKKDKPGSPRSSALWGVKEPFDYVVYFFMVATPLFELPQAHAIYSSKNAESVSPYTWGFFFIASMVWLTYAVRNKLKPLIIMYSMYLIVEASIVAGIIMYS